jgi:ABC-type multidrug transport system ATPase subunit
MMLTKWDLTSTFLYLIATVGYWGLFAKCGVKGIWSLIPLAREYHLSLCADKEKDGRALTIATIVGDILLIAMRFPGLETKVYLIMLIGFVPIEITITVYMIRILSGLTKVFNRSRKWILPLLLSDNALIVIWGYSPKFQPTRQVINYKHEKGAKAFDGDVDTINDGLTINIKQRTAIDFFTKKVLLKDIHMAIPKGHMVLLLGGSGAGKTTFVNAVTGYEKADAQILLDGRNVYEEYSKMMYDIGFVPQQDLMRGNDTVALTLSDAASLRLPSSVHMFDRFKRIDAVLEQFGLTAVKNNLVEKLSGGQRKRLSIAMEFISDPTLFILDEPDSGLDGVVARGLFEKLRAIADQGKIVVVITHTPDRVIDLFDDVIVLAKDAKRTGRLAWYGPVKEAYEFFGKNSMEEILLSVNQKEEGGEGRADAFVEKYADRMKEKVG